MNPGLYTVLFENGRVRLLEYRDSAIAWLLACARKYSWR